MHRDALLLDPGHYRNATVAHAHNVITLEGLAPAEIRERALRDIAAYDTVQVRQAHVDTVERDASGFSVTLGDETLTARTVILATGLRDTLPDIRGPREVWGVEAANCPFCHGHDFAGRTVGLLGMGDHAGAMAAMLAPVVAESVELTDVSSIERIDGGLRLEIPGADPLEVAGIFLRADFAQSAPFAEQLGLAMLPSGCIEIDILGSTSVPAAAGQVAAAMCVRTAAMASL